MPSYRRTHRCFMAINEEGMTQIKMNGTIYGVSGFAWRKTFKGKRCVVVYCDLSNGTRIIALLSLKGTVLAALDFENCNINEQKKCIKEATYFLKLSNARRGNKIFAANIERFFNSGQTQQNTDNFKLEDPDETEEEDIRNNCILN